LLAHWPIRYKLLFAATLLCSIMAILSFSSFRGVYAYRELVRGISQRSAELEPASRLTARVGELRFALRPTYSLHDFPHSISPPAGWMREHFSVNLFAVKDALDRYHVALRSSEPEDPYIGDKRGEWETVRAIDQCLKRIGQLRDTTDWALEPVVDSELDEEVERLALLTGELPAFLHAKMREFRDHVRGQYRTWIVLAWTATVLTGLALAWLVRLFYVWVFRPLRVLIEGSRRVAAGDFAHRIQLTTHDEVAELADAMNAMTRRFQEIRDDLNQQVRLRTKEVVRSEQLASVGFLAAGVAHEINNPLASIAWSAESLEMRLHDIIQQDDEKPDGEHCEEIALLRDYLRRIQDEAFRCKEITERLLDFSRLGDMEKQETDLAQLAADVIDMVRHLGRYREKNIEFEQDEASTPP
jgi:two-component system, NtrC family, sensor kinase